MPPGSPLPKLVQVNSSLHTRYSASSDMPVFASSDSSIRFCPLPSTCGSSSPQGSANSKASAGRSFSGSLPYSVSAASRLRFVSAPTSPASSPSGSSQP